MAVLMDYLTMAAQEGASDLFLVPGAPVTMKLDGLFRPLEEEKIMPSRGEALIREIYAMAQREIAPLLSTGDDDFSFPYRVWPDSGSTRTGSGVLWQPLCESWPSVCRTGRPWESRFPSWNWQSWTAAWFL